MILITDSLNYLDPGTGSYLYQVLIAAGVTVGLYYKNLKIYFSNLAQNIKNRTKNKKN
tara:strand:- start:53 stop:226 length:174 start_codon:yes stop_codon:yes gene_type:complete